MLVRCQILTVQGRECAVTQREQRGMCRTYTWAASYYCRVQYKKLMEGRNKLMKASVTQHRGRPIKCPDVSGLEGLGHCTA